MPGIFGMLGLADNDATTTVRDIGESRTFEVARAYLEAHAEEAAAASAVLVEEQTEVFKEGYALPGGGTLQEIGEFDRPGAVKSYGGWDVAYPLRNYGAQAAISRQAEAYLTIARLNRELETIRIQDINTRRREMLKALFNNTARTFYDKTPNGSGVVGNLTIQPLANNDSTLYPPVAGSDTEATANHYLASGYAASAISDTNNPYVTLRQKLEAWGGTPQGYGDVMVWINTAQVALTEDLSDFVPVEDMHIQPGDDQAQVIGLPEGMGFPGRIVGRTNGVWVLEWKWIPANYLLSVDPSVGAPLKERVHPESTGLPRGLSLIAEEERYPIRTRVYENAFGFGVGNRLAAAVMELTTDPAYDIPALYA